MKNFAGKGNKLFFNCSVFYAKLHRNAMGFTDITSQRGGEGREMHKKVGI